MSMLNQDKDRLVRFGQVSQMLGGVSRVTLWRWEKDKSLNFPQRVRLQGRSLAWRESDIIAWIGNREKYGISS
jgi:predicted DNA-binding transcriptional regulator AlpA